MFDVWVIMLDKRTIARIKASLRAASVFHPARLSVKNKAKIAPALFKCECGCKTAIYEGTSESTFRQYKEQFAELWILKGKGQIDHIAPVREGKRDQPIDWNDYIESLFCSEDNLQYLSKSCHQLKSERDRNNATKSTQSNSEVLSGKPRSKTKAQRVPKEEKQNQVGNRKSGGVKPNPKKGNPRRKG